ncbi:MAG: ANTAR domain-containing protein, partial [Nocardioidaceae bacterium]
TDTRWPRWGPRAGELGIASVISIGLSAPPGITGAVSLYSRTVRTYGDHDLMQAHTVAAEASAVLATIHRHAQVHTEADTTTVVARAQGILMERHGLSADQAFQLLNRLSQDNDAKLGEIATELIDDSDPS